MNAEIEKLQETIKNHDRMAQTLPAPHRMQYVIKAREARAQLAELRAAEQPRR